MALQRFSTGDYDNPGFVEKLKQLVFPDLEPENLQFPHARFIQNGLIAAQTYVECLRSNNVNFYDRDDVTVNCDVATLVIPEHARVQAVYVFKPGRNCSRIHYDQRGMGAIGCYGDSRRQCSTDPSASEVVFNSTMSGAAFCEQTDLVISESAFKCSERIFAKGSCDKLHLAPMFPCDYKLAVHWEGLKRSYSDTDLISDEEDLLDVISLWLRGERALWIDRDKETADAIMRKPMRPGDWGGAFWQRLMDMKHRCREERRIRRNYLCDAIFDDSALIDPCEAETPEITTCGVNQYELNGVCVDCAAPTVFITANHSSINLGESVIVEWSSQVPDIDSSIVTLEYGSTVTPVARNAINTLTVSPAADTTYTIRAVTVCGNAIATIHVGVKVIEPCLCPSGLPDCLQLDVVDPSNFLIGGQCFGASTGGDGNPWDGVIPRVSDCLWRVDFGDLDASGVGGFYTLFPDSTPTAFKVLVELVSCNPFTYEMTFTIPIHIEVGELAGTWQDYPIWKGRCINHPVGTYSSEAFGVGIRDVFCSEDTDFSVNGCFDAPCSKPVVTFDPPAGSHVNLPSLVFLHSTNFNDFIYYRIDGGEYQPYTGAFSSGSASIDAYAITADGCLGDVSSSGYVSDDGLAFEFICDGSHDKAGVFNEFHGNGQNNDYHFRIKPTRAVPWTLHNVKIYETNSSGVWVTGQVWSTVSPVFPTEISPAPYSSYPLVLFSGATQLNTNYTDPLSAFAAGLTTLDGYGQPFIPLTGYFRLEITIDEGGSPFTIYKLIPHSCQDCGTVGTPTVSADCSGNVVITATVSVGSNYRILYSDECDNSVFVQLVTGISVDGNISTTIVGGEGCRISFIVEVFCAISNSWIQSGVGSVVVPAPCPVDCVLSAWSDWQTYTDYNDCEDGEQTKVEFRTRTVITPASNGGAPCGPLFETRAITRPCGDCFTDLSAADDIVAASPGATGSINSCPSPMTSFGHSYTSFPITCDDRRYDVSAVLCSENSSYGWIFTVTVVSTGDEQWRGGLAGTSPFGSYTQIGAAAPALDGQSATLTFSD